MNRAARPRQRSTDGVPPHLALSAMPGYGAFGGYAPPPGFGAMPAPRQSQQTLPLNLENKRGPKGANLAVFCIPNAYNDQKARRRPDRTLPTAQPHSSGGRDALTQAQAREANMLTQPAATPIPRRHDATPAGSLVGPRSSAPPYVHGTSERSLYI